MNFVTMYYIWLKCYLNIFEIVATEMRSRTYLALALNKLRFFLIKKLMENNYFFKTTVMSFLSVVTIHVNLSSGLSSKIPTISDGIVVLNDFDLGFCNMTFDFTSNNFIHSFLSFVINIFDKILYIFYPKLH